MNSPLVPPPPPAPLTYAAAPVRRSGSGGWTLVCIGLALLAGWFFWQYSQAVVGWKAAQQSGQEARTSLAQARDETRRLESNLSISQEQLAAEKSERGMLQSALIGAEAKTADLESQLQQARIRASAAEARLREIAILFDGKDPSLIAAQWQTASEQMRRLAAREQELTGQLQEARTEVTRLEGLLAHRRTGQTPEGVRGRVVQVDRKWNFAVLDIGQQQGLVENGLLWIYRGQTRVGRVRIISVDADTAIADILPEETRQPIQIGDEALN